MGRSESSQISQAPEEDLTDFEGLVRRCQERVYRVAYRMTGNVADAQELTQEAFFRAYVARDSFDGRARVSTWLYRIVVNLCLDHARRHRHTPADLDGIELVDPGPGPLEHLTQGEEVMAVRQAIASLPPQQRATVILRLHEGLSYREIGEILGCVDGTAKANYFHAVAKLREKLRPTDPQEEKAHRELC